ncbi:hypothetical protein GJA_1749 [Janthinobacterium agaricidamnosum NBRC 102515 = DSM 9628]|uniref:Uncharacterized protein n=1 Tax=Janthinobacterium agaricidamnosum NBRC 102515 = DSM 9628 TaxID=1349767 RepID=W0V457_9BURK|nr:hypothetical protein GJA_1749 [Janthinobacterium agaricidamnosum NBRC 102515 = DSM 9628]
MDNSWNLYILLFFDEPPNGRICRAVAAHRSVSPYECNKLLI